MTTNVSKTWADWLFRDCLYPCHFTNFPYIRIATLEYPFSNWPRIECPDLKMDGWKSTDSLTIPIPAPPPFRSLLSRIKLRLGKLILRSIAQKGFSAYRQPCQAVVGYNIIRHVRINFSFGKIKFVIHSMVHNNITFGWKEMNNRENNKPSSSTNAAEASEKYSGLWVG